MWKSEVFLASIDSFFITFVIITGMECTKNVMIFWKCYKNEKSRFELHTD